MSAEGRSGPEVVVVDSDLDSDEGEVQSGAGLDFLPLDPVPGSTRGRKRRREAQGGTQEPDAPVWRGAGQNEFTSLPQHSSLLRLHEEVLEFVSMMRPTAAEEEAANVTLLRVVSVVKHGWPDAEITLFGSRASGMALPEADWDICLNGDLRQSGHAREVEVIAKARVPIVKYCDAQSGIWVDISFNQDTGADSTRFIQEAASEWPQLRPMMLVLKYYLKQRGLAETYRGGIGSFLLSVMCIRALQVLRDQMAQSMQAQAAASRPKGSLPSWHKALKKGKTAPLISSLNIGAALMAFFELYGVKLNYVEVAISVRGAGAFFRKRASRLFNKSTRLDGLCVESPVDTTLDVG
ncbi:Trf4-1, partial [Symbiodinium sp. KB8]